MTLTDAAIGAAALWLLFVVSGIPGQRADRVAFADDPAALFAAAPVARLAPLPYSVWHEDRPLPRHVTPPLPDNGSSSSGITHNALGSTPVRAIGLPQMLSLTEVTIAPGADLALTNLGGSGVIVLQAGWLELTTLDGDARLSRSPLAAASAPREDEDFPTLAPGDRLTFGPGADIVLRNRGEHPAQLLAASVLATPGLAA